MGPAALVSEGNEEVGLNFDAVRCDVVEFDRSIESGHLSEALDIYRGHLLEGFFISDAPQFERWLEVARARRRDFRLTQAARISFASRKSKARRPLFA